MGNPLYAVLFALVLGGIYAFLYTMNHKTPVPKGCEDLTVACDGCRVTSCELHPVNRMTKENDHD
ncbi:MAG: hypothetical protein HUJ57_03320 [Erysipelotrichaceae bacterium]|nr:hypothetical protein [Erysipelotrichaceae bacterium]